MSRLLYILIFISTIANAQFGSQQVISTAGNGPQRVFAADLDGDTYKDVISANKFGSDLTWYKNMGNGSFGPQQIIASLNQTINLYAADLDGDNDVDVLAVSGPENWVVWYENLDGLGNFGTQQIIDDDVLLAHHVIAADLDGDLDLDVITSSDGSNSIYWYENLDGNGNFSLKKIVATSGNNGRSIFAVDLDGDDDIDILASSSGSETISWYENTDGLGTFGTQQVIAGSAPGVSSVFAADLDGDLDNDVLATTNSDDKVAWFENLDGLGNFGEEQIITTQADFALSVFATDLDNDNDMDVLSASALDNKIAWYKNTDGQGSFSSQNIISTDMIGAVDVYATDLDNDGDMDVLSASQNDDKIAWYENLTILAIEGPLLSKIELYPNPVKDTLYIKSQVPISMVCMYSLLGKKVLEKEGDAIQNINISQLSAGIYFVEIEAENEKVLSKIVKE